VPLRCGAVVLTGSVWAMDVANHNVPAECGSTMFAIARDVKTGLFDGFPLLEKSESTASTCLRTCPTRRGSLGFTLGMKEKSHNPSIADGDRSRQQPVTLSHAAAGSYYDINPPLIP
jgi:hypothetical protein